MKKILILSIALMGMMITGCQNVHTASYNQGINIIPTPKTMTLDESQRFTLAKNTTISSEDAQGLAVAEFFAKSVNLATGYSVQAVAQGGDVELILNPEMECKAEGYTLQITPQKVVATAKDGAGLFYAMQTLMQLFPAEITSLEKVESSEWSVPCGDISDEPRFEYRGIMLDVCRHFMPVEFVKEQLDIFAMFKINRMHWHLTEDQAWRVEIKKYPKLTEIGSKRIEGEGYEYSGFYTQDEIRDIVAYAAERQITIIPEFELPGHELAAIAAYPELSCKGEPVSPRIIWGVEDIVMCPAKDITFQFIEDVIEEMTALFPGEYFHIGGDECPKVSWANCPECQKFIRQHGLQAKDGHSAEERLQSYIITRAEEMLAQRGKKLIGWDEILEGGLSPNATVMSWRGESGGISSAMMGHNVIMTPNPTGMYFDQYQGDYLIEPVAIGGYTPLSRVYDYDPVPAKLVESGMQDMVLGVQANLWSEYMYTTELMEYRLYPRVLAVAEIGWSELENKDYDSFIRRVDNAYVRLDSYDVNYHIPQPEQPGGSYNHLVFTDSITVEFTTTRPITMVYTCDGSEPTAKSAIYTKPLMFTEDTNLKIRSMLPSGKMSPVRNIIIEQQEFSPAVAVESPVKGLKMKTWIGEYLNMDAFSKAVTVPEESVIENIRKVVKSVSVGAALEGVVDGYANVAEGYIEIPSDGVYHIWSNNNEVWIDDALLISNDNEVKRFSRNSKSIALSKGLHPIKVVWLGHIIGGWPSYWDDGNVRIINAQTNEVVSLNIYH